MRIFLLWSFLFFQIAAVAQKTEQGFDHDFKPTVYAPRYYVITEKRDSFWHREAYYLPETSMAMQGRYKDAACKIAHGEWVWYHSNKILKTKGTYTDGLKEGLWLQFGEDGRMNDSGSFSGGRLKGTRLRWDADGYLTDSTQFDGAGNGTEVTWYPAGTVSSAGLWVSDTVRNGRWKFYHPNSQIKATEDYVAGERISVACFDEQGKPLAPDACTEKEAGFPGGVDAWIRFIQRNLKADVPVRLKAPLGQYTVVVQFVVNRDGSIEDIKPITRFGFGMEEEVERMLKRSPRWLPAHQFGNNVKAYRKQPITFIVSQG